MTYHIEIKQDDCFESPREWDNLGTMVCWHKRYTLGDEQPKETPEQYQLNLVSDYFTDAEYDHAWEWAAYNNLCAWKEKVERLLDNHFIMLPLYLYDHSGITMNTSGFSCPWDSGQVGFIYVSIEDVKKEWHWKRLTKKRREKIESYLCNEVTTYDQYLTGNVWGYIITNDDEEIVESCWGFYGEDCCMHEAQEVVKYLEDKNG